MAAVEMFQLLTVKIVNLCSKAENLSAELTF